LKLETENVLKEDLTEENILQKVSKVIQLLRECNVTLRWMILHCSAPIGNISVNLLFTISYYISYINILMAGSDTIKKVKQIRDLVINETKFDPERVLQLLLNVAQLELKIKDLFRKVSFIILFRIY